MDQLAYYWLSKSPLVLRYTMPMDNEESFRLFIESLPHSRMYHLPVYYWHYSCDEIEARHQQLKQARPQHVLHHLLNEREICEEVNARGLIASLVHHNAFLDECIFEIAPGGEKHFNAVYTARMSPFKRHLLAREVERLLLIGGVMAARDSREYLAQLQREMPGATFEHARHNEFLPALEVARLLNQAKVGLCLSACEGGMFSATEYMLCGLPVVSTRSVGGRDEWFDFDFVRVTRDDPSAVREAVEELIALGPPPQVVRQRTLTKVWEHRQRFIGIVQRIYDYELACRDFAREWYPRFFNKMTFWRHPGEVMHHLEKDCRPA